VVLRRDLGERRRWRLVFVVAIFYDATSTGFQTLPTSSNRILMPFGGTLPNATYFPVAVASSQVVVVADERRSQGNWSDFGSWAGNLQSGDWEVRFEDQSQGISDTFCLRSVSQGCSVVRFADVPIMLISLYQLAPPHFACGLPGAGVSELVLPHIGWENAVPDVEATVELDVQGTRLAFTGYGYHDRAYEKPHLCNQTIG